MVQRKSYQTKQQEAVSVLFASRAEDCLTAEEAYAALLEVGMDVGQTTVYRVIARLCAAGTLRRYAPHDRADAASYQHNPCKESHLHIRCSACGVLEHLHCNEVDAFAAHLTAHHAFTLDEGQTILYGLCRDCRLKQDTEE